MWNPIRNYYERPLNAKIAKLESAIIEAAKEKIKSNEVFQGQRKRIAELDYENKTLKWQIENPAKFKKGQKVGDWLVLGVKLVKPKQPTWFEILAKGLIFIDRTHSLFKKASLPLHTEFGVWDWPYFEYQVAHMATGDQGTMPEDKLLAQKKTNEKTKTA
jgi:hypothetical protein